LKELVTRIKLESKEFTRDLESGKGAALAFSAAISTAAAGMAFLATNTANTIENNTKLSRAAGENSKEFSQLAFAAKLGGVEMENLSAGMAKMAKSDSQKNLRAMGIAVTDTNGKLRSQTDMLLDLSALIQKTEDPLKRLQLAQSALGKSGGQYLEFLKDGPEGIRALMKESEALGQVFTGQDAAAADLFNDKLDVLKIGIEGVGLTIRKSIIQWVNHSGAMEFATNIVKGAIAAWNSMDQSTKDFLFTFVAATAGAAALGAALYGVYTVAPLVGAALKAAFVTNPIGLVLTAVGLVAAAVIHMKNHWEDFSKFFAPVTKMFDEFRTRAGGAVNFVLTIMGQLGAKLSPLKGVFDSISDSFKNVDIVSSALKLSLAPLLITFYSLALVVGIFSDALKGLFELMQSDFGKGMGIFLAGTMSGNIALQIEGIKKMSDGWEAMGAKFKETIGNMKGRLDRFSGDVVATVKNIATKSKPEMDKLFEPPPNAHEDPATDPIVKKAKTYSNVFYNAAESAWAFFAALEAVDEKGNKLPMLERLADSMEAIKPALQSLGSGFSDLMGSQAKLEQARFSNFQQRNQFMVKALGAFEDIALEQQKARLDSEIAALTAQKDALVAEERAYQERLKQIRDEYAEQRSSELDAELQKEFDLLDARYNAQVEMLEKSGITGAEAEARKADFLAENEDKKNQLIAQSNKRLQKDIEKKNKELADDEAKKAKATKQREDDLALHIQMLEEQKTAAAEASANRKMELDRLSRLQEWQAGRASFEVSKRAQIAQIGASMAMSALNAVQAGILLASSVPVVGWTMGPVLTAALSTMAFAAGANALRGVMTQQYPPPPLFDDGGISRGRAQGNGWRSEDAEMHIPLSNPGKDFGALKGEVAKLLLPDDYGGRRVSIENLQVVNHFGAREDYEEIKEKINADIRDMVKGALEG